jgi:hypothetical protein
VIGTGRARTLNECREEINTDRIYIQNGWFEGMLTIHEPGPKH